MFWREAVVDVNDDDLKLAAEYATKKLLSIQIARDEAAAVGHDQEWRTVALTGSWMIDANRYIEIRAAGYRSFAG